MFLKARPLAQVSIDEKYFGGPPPTYLFTSLDEVVSMIEEG